MASTRSRNAVGTVRLAMAHWSTARIARCTPKFRRSIHSLVGPSVEKRASVRPFFMLAKVHSSVNFSAYMLPWKRPSSSTAYGRHKSEKYSMCEEEIQCIESRSGDSVNIRGNSAHTGEKRKTKIESKRTIENI